jgi:hypothetical protein
MNAVLRKMTASDAVAVFLRAAEGMDPKIASAFIRAIEQIRTRVPAEQIARMIERRDFVSLENAFSGHFSSTEWQPYGAAVEQAVLAGVKATSDTQGVVNGAQEDFQIAVGLNPRLEQFAITLTSTRIREIDQTTRDTIRQVLQRGLTAGDDPFAIARQIRGSIGLTRRQEAAVSNYERMLRALDPEALDRKLRDRRSDGTVERAIRADKALTEAQIRSLVDRYRDRYVKYRANVIARTESIRAVQGAQWELFQDMINKGQIDARQVRRTWIHTGDAHVRNAHLQIPSLNPRGVGQAETFTSPLGPILYPGDPNALAANTIQCRCAVFARIIDRGLLPSTSPGVVAAPPPPLPPVAARPLPAMTEERRGEPEPAFAYESYKPLKNLEQIEEFVKTSGISGKADLKGTSVDALNVALPAMQEVVERFGLKPLAAFGNITRFYSRIRGPKGALAAIYTSITDSQTGNKGIFHIPASGFGKGSADIARIAQRNAPRYKEQREKALQGTDLNRKFKHVVVSDEVRERIKQMSDEPGSDYNWTVDATSTDPKLTTRSTVFHEYGHVIHLTNQEIGDIINEFLRTHAPLRGGWDLLVSVYGATNEKEYIAETFAIYMGMPESQHFRIHPELLKIYRRLDRKVTR